MWRKPILFRIYLFSYLSDDWKNQETNIILKIRRLSPNAMLGNMQLLLRPGLPLYLLFDI